MSEALIIKPGSSLERVLADAARRDLSISLKVMQQSTRTAEDAAAACGCAVGQIVKSLVFEDQSGTLVLMLVAGDRNVDLSYLADSYGLVLKRCDGRRVRDETGFAIGGVSPIGHLQPIRTYFDCSLLAHDMVWAAAGRPDAVFGVAPQALAASLAPDIIRVVRD